eukprot:238078-Prymnesium_polylepis.1
MSLAPAATPALFAIGDLHGDLERAHAALGLAGLANASGHWLGGTATLVQTGDLVDRGPHSLEVIKLFEALEVQAHAAGGRLQRLLGNHEVLNMEGDVRYVHPAELSSVGGRAKWSALFEPNEGALASRLTKYPTATVAGSGACRTLFVHGGLQPRYLRGGGGWSAQLADLNERFRGGLLLARKGRGGAANLDKESRQKLELLGNEGPVWYRGYALGQESAVCDALRATLDAAGAWRMVVGHTITADHTHVQVRCGGLYHMIDVRAPPAPASPALAPRPSRTPLPRPSCGALS